MSNSSTDSEVLHSWEDFDMINSRQKGQIRRYREMATSMYTDDKYAKFVYSLDNNIQLTNKPSVSDVMIQQDYVCTDVNDQRMHPIWGYCQRCASSRIGKATHVVRERMGHTVIRCGACGKLGAVRFFVNNNNSYGWVNDRYSWDNPPKYRVTSADNRCYNPSYRGIDNFFEITDNVPCKRRRSIISLDHRPQVWVQDSKSDGGLFLPDDVKQKWINKKYNPHSDINFDKSEFRFPNENIVI